MHIQEVFNAIYSNHCYEYFIIDTNYKVIEYSDKVFDYCDTSSKDIFELVPELYGLDEQLEDILYGRVSSYKIPIVFKNNYYVNIHIYPGRKYLGSIKGSYYETLIILFEDVTTISKTKQQLIQEKNEKTLLLEDISTKNRQLEVYNSKMHQLVQEEIKKNLEQQKMLELQSRYSQMGEIIGMITHQWKQPLNAISMMANVLILKHRNNTLDTTVLEDKLNDIVVQVKYMSQTVNDFQQFFNPVKEKVYFKVYDTISSVLELVKTEYFNKNIVVTLKGDNSSRAFGLPNELNQVVLSILKNSKDEFFKSPKESMWIDIDVSTEDDSVKVEISDNAGGISEDIIDKIFDVHFTTKEDGSGLGLNISKNMIEEHMNGSLEVENIDSGAKFTIKLPIKG